MYYFCSNLSSCNRGGTERQEAGEGCEILFLAQGESTIS